MMPCFVLKQCADSELYSAISVQQFSSGRQVAALENIAMTPSQQTFALITLILS